MENIIILCTECGKNKAAKGRKKCWTCTGKQRSPEAAERRRIKTNARVNKWTKAHREQVNVWRRGHRVTLKETIIERYGGKCACCGESNMGFLTIDHINNDGHERRKEFLAERNIHEHLINKPVDFETYQVLCFNCNFGKNCNNGICPHLEFESSVNV